MSPVGALNVAVSAAPFENPGVPPQTPANVVTWPPDIFLMQSFDDPSKASEDEWDNIITQARKKADENKEENKIILEKMTKEEKNRYKEIGKLIKKGNLTEEQEKALLKEMNDIRQRILAR